MAEPKTEPPSPRKLARARARGEVWRSQLATSAALLVTVAVALFWLGPAVATQLTQSLTDAIVAAVSTTPPAPALALERGFALLIKTIFPFLLIALGAALTMDVAQVRPLFSLKALLPRSDRFALGVGLRASFGARAWRGAAFRLVASLATFAVLGLTVWEAVGPLAAASRYGLRTLLAVTGRFVWLLLFRASLTLLVFGVLDIFRERAAYLEAQKMSRRELERERKETEGDPLIHAARSRRFDELRRQKR